MIILRKPSHYFFTGVLIGFLLVFLAAYCGSLALRYFSTGEGIGKVKGLYRLLFKERAPG